jgi:hypothetical protein
MGFEPQQPFSTLELAVFTPGDRVWLDGSDITANRPSSKLSHRHLGLFVELSPSSSTAFTLSSLWSSCPSYFLTSSLADDLRHPHPQLS